MSTPKTTDNGAAEKRAGRKFRIDDNDDAGQSPLGNIEVTQLKVEQDKDTGCDPYNSTGQFCVIDFER